MRTAELSKMEWMALDEPGDLSASTLYAAKVTQLEDESFDLEWIELASGSNDEIAEMMEEMELPE